MFVVVTRMIASVGSWIVGSGTSSTRDLLLALPGECSHGRPRARGPAHVPLPGPIGDTGRVTLLLLSTADTDLLAARAVDRPGAAAAAREPGPADRPGRPRRASRSSSSGCSAAAARGTASTTSPRPAPPAACRWSRSAGEGSVDAELTTLSTVRARASSPTPPATCARAARRTCASSSRSCPTPCCSPATASRPPAPLPAARRPRRPRARPEGRPTVGVVFYRAHALSGNTAFVDVLCDAVEAAGANALPVYVASLRPDADGAVAPVEELLAGRVDALVVTVLAGGGSNAADTEGWDARALAALDVPVLQGLCVTSSRAAWEASDAGLAPIDAAMQVAIPEFDGRLIGPPFSFKEEGPDGVPTYVADPERAARVAGVAVAHARLRSMPNAEKKVALVLSSYPTKHSRVGNAVGLDTPASAVQAAAGDAGRRATTVGGVPRGRRRARPHPHRRGRPRRRVAHRGAARGRRRPGAAGASTGQWFDALPASLRDGMLEHWGPPPGQLYVDGDAIALAALQFGNVVLMIQPPRGFGENPIAIYHDPDLPPSHHYLAAYRWLEQSVRRARGRPRRQARDARVAARQGPRAVGRLRARRRARRPAAVLPVHRQRPGRGDAGQAPRPRDRRRPPRAADGARGVLRRDGPARAAARRVRAGAGDGPGEAAGHPPADLGARRAGASCTTTCTSRRRRRDEEFDDFLLHVDGYLCEVKDVLIRDGLHVLGQAPEGLPLVDLVLGVLRAQQTWGGSTDALPGLRRALGLVEGGRRRGDRPASRRRPARSCIALADAGLGRRPAVDALSRRRGRPRRCCASPAPRSCRAWRRTTDELDHLLHGLSGGFVPAGPSGSPTRGLVGVLPTGRNFYSVDPKAIPSRNAWTVGKALGDSLRRALPRRPRRAPRLRRARRLGDERDAHRRRRHRRGALAARRPSRSGTRRRAASPASTLVPREELGRPRVDVTLRISGFFRDAFPHVVALLDDAVQLAASARRRPTTRCARTSRPTWPRARPAGRRPRASSAASRGRTAPGCCRSSTAATGRPTPTSPRSGRSGAATPTAPAWTGCAARGGHGARLHAGAGRGEEPGHPRARHHRLRRLLPVPRRDGRGGPRADRHLAGGLRRRQRRAGHREDAHAAGGDAPRVPRPRRQPEVDGRDAPPRLQGRVRDGRDRRLPVRLRRHRRRGRGLDVREAHAAPTSSTRRTGRSCRRATPGRCAASPSGCSRPPSAGCGRSRRRRRCRG